MPKGPPVTSDAPPREAGSGKQEHQHVVARYGRMGFIGQFRHDLDPGPGPGGNVVLRSQRGTEIGEVLTCVDQAGPRCISAGSLQSYLTACGSDYPFHRRGKILRIATAQDFNDQQHLDKSAAEEAAFCREQIDGLSLDMKVVEVEHLLGGERIVFFFTSENRVDFRELVHRLAGAYHTRIEMLQVGARDEARLMADYERCGRRCCCQEFLKFLKPISMRMAKVQKATLDPAKISGRCGRLMCCLQFEDAMYSELQATLPRRNIWVRTEDGTVGRVQDMQVLTQLVRLMLPDRSEVVVPNAEIVERDVPEPPAEEPSGRRGAGRPRPPKPAQVEKPLAQPASEGAAAERPAEEKSKRRRRRRQRPKASDAQAQAAPAQASGQAPSGQGGAGAPRKKRRRRRKPRGTGSTGGSSGRPSP